jgi:hypothetical protein
MGEHVERSSDATLRAPALTALYAELNELLLDGPGLSEFVAAVADLAASVVPGSRCLITLRRVRGGAATRAGAGTRRISPQAAPGEFAVPLEVGGTEVGTMRIDPGEHGEFSVPELDRLRAFSRQAAVALALMLRQSAHLTLDDELQEALATRAVIDQALGVLMHARKVSAREAFEVLRAASQASNRKVSVVAAEVIETLTGHAPERPRPLTQRDPLLPPEAPGS